MVIRNYSFFGSVEYGVVRFSFLGKQKLEKTNDINKPGTSVWSFWLVDLVEGRTCCGLFL